MGCRFLVQLLSPIHLQKKGQNCSKQIKVVMLKKCKWTRTPGKVAVGCLSYSQGGKHSLGYNNMSEWLAIVFHSHVL